MILREFFKHTLVEGGNLEIDGAQAQTIDLKVHDRAYITPILNSLLHSINNGFQQSVGGPLWSAKVLKSRKYLSGSSLHFFDTDIPDDEFERVKPKVGDIDTQVNKETEQQLAQWLDSVKGQIVGNAKFLGYSRGNEQYSSLWELTDPPIKVQIDFEFVDYGEKGEPTDWSAFSHSSSWEDLSQGIKGVFHKYLIQAFTKLSTQEFLLRKMVGRGKARAEQDVPTTDNMFSFAVSSKEGGGLRPKYEPVADEKGRPLEINGLPVMRALPASGYEKDLSTMFQNIFGQRVNRKTLEKMLPKTWSFTGLLELMNLILPQEEKEQVLDSLVDKLFAPGAQGLYKGDPQRDMTEKNAALNYALKVLKVTAPKNLEQMRQDYVKNYKVTSEGPVGLDRPIDEAEGDNQGPIKAQLRKGMPHLRDLKPADFLDLIDELRSEGGRFKLQNIPLNVKIDGFGGRFGKDSQGKPFMGTSNTPPKYESGFVKYHQAKGTTDPEILGRAANFDKLFDEMIKAVKVVDNKLGPEILMNKQVSCEVLFLPFATQTSEGKLKFVGIEYDQFPQGVDLVLVPYRVVDADSGEEPADAEQVVQSLRELGQNGSVAFMSNQLLQKEGLDVTEIINPLDNLEELKKIVSDTAGKRDRASLELRREVEAKLKPVQIALEKAIDEDPNIVGKDNLGQDYEGIVINSQLGPIKVTSQKQKDIIVAKNAAKKAAWAEQPRENSNKTAVVAIGSFVGHIGHEQLWDYTIKKAAQVGGDPYLFIGNAEGKDDPIPPVVKVQTWHKMYPQYAKNISTVQEGGSLIQKIKHELINPLPGKPPRYDNIIIMVGEDQAKMNIANALMKAVNKFQGYEHVKVSLEATPRGTGMSFTKLRNILKDPNATPEQQYAVWAQGFDVNKLGKSWILHLMDITRKGMGIQQPKQDPVQVKEQRLFNALVRPINETDERQYHGWKEYDEDKSSQVAEFLHEMQPKLFSRYGDEFLMSLIQKMCHENPQASITQSAGNVIRHLKNNVDEERMSAAVKLQRAFDRERTKSDASRRRGEEIMAQAKSDWEKKQAAEKNKSLAESQFDLIEEFVERLAEEHGVDPEIIWDDFESVDDATLLEAAAWQKKSGKSKTGGLNDRGIASYRREHPGSKLQKAVTTKPSKLKKGSKAAKRRKSFCARMSGVKGPMKKPNGKPTRKALALRKWNCHEGVAEAVHPDVVSKNYFNEPTKNVRMGDFEFNARTFTGGLGTPNARGLQIRAYDPKLPKDSLSIGRADFIVKSDKKGRQWLESDDTEVDDKYRGKGVATMMYAFAKSLGNDIERSPYQSKAGSTMWNKWGSDAKHLVGEEGLAEGSEQQINWVKPNFDFEWHEVEEQSKMEQVPIDVRHYYEKYFPNKEAWLKSVQNGRVVNVKPDHTFEIRNMPHDKQSLMKALAPTGHEGPLGPAKEKRVNALFDKGGTIEMPIILKTNKGLWLIGGKTRLGTANYIKGISAKVWMIGGKQGVAEGSSGAKYKVKSIGKDAKGEYYVSPNTGKKVYKKAAVGDHETPSGEVKPKVIEAESKAMDQTAKRLTDPKDGATAKLRAVGDKKRQGNLAQQQSHGRSDEAANVAQQAAIAISMKKAGKKPESESMLPKSAFAGSDKNKLGSAGQWKNTGPKKNKPARAGDLVGGSAEESIEREEKQRLDPSCWKSYRKAGTKMKGGVRVNNCVPVSEDVQNIMDVLINKIIVNETVPYNK